MLKKQRKINNLTQNQLATGSGVSVKMIQKYEQGVRNIDAAKLETLLKLCNTLNCDLVDVINSPKLKELIETYETRLRSDNHG